MLRISLWGVLAVASHGLGASLEEGCGRDENPVALMQLSSKVRREPLYVDLINAAQTPAERAARLKPVAWFHPMKCGSSLFNVLVGLDSLWEACPEEARLDPATEKGETTDAVSPMLKLCPGVFGEIPPACKDAQCYWGGHMGIGATYEANRGHFVGMFRQPEQLLMSGFKESHAWFREEPPADELEYAVVMQGCMTKMLARDSWLSPCRSDDPEPPTKEEVALALHRLRTGFAWVGITHRWTMSVCTFHAKFGGDCKDSDLLNVNMGEQRNEYLYDTSRLRGFEDRADGIIFAEAQLMMHEDMNRYNVSEHSCEKMCR